MFKWRISEILRANDDNETPEIKDDLSLLNEDDVTDDKDDDLDEEDDKTTDDDVDDSDESDDADEDDEDEEDNEKEEVVNSVSFKDVKAYLATFRAEDGSVPDIYKKFPGLKQAFFRGEAFAARFSTAEQADEALNKADNFDRLSEAVVTGDVKTLLDDLEANNPKGLKEFATNFLSDLMEVDEDLYYSVTRPVIKNVIRGIFDHGVKEKDENIQKAAKIINKLVFNSSYNSEPDKVDLKRNKPDSDPKIEKFYKEQGQKLHSEVSGAVVASLDKEIEKNLDPTNSMKSGVKKLIVKQIRDEVMQQVAADKSHLSRMDAFWNREKRLGYSGTLKDSIKNAYLSRARSIIPSVRAKVRKEVLGTQKVSDTKLKDKLQSRTNRLPAGPGSGGKKVVTVAEARKGRMSDKDIINA